jgi:hypothetical protein
MELTVVESKHRHRLPANVNWRLLTIAPKTLTTRTTAVRPDQRQSFAVRGVSTLRSENPVGSKVLVIHANCGRLRLGQQCTLTTKAPSMIAQAPRTVLPKKAASSLLGRMFEKSRPIGVPGIHRPVGRPSSLRNGRSIFCDGAHHRRQYDVIPDAAFEESGGGRPCPRLYIRRGAAIRKSNSSWRQYNYIAEDPRCE